MVSQKNCLCFQQKVTFLRLLVGCNGIQVDPEKAEVIKNWARPENLTELSRFLGIVLFFKRLIKKFLELARPLKNQTKS